MDLIKEKSPALLARQTGLGIEITDRRTVLSVFKITQSGGQVKHQGGGCENIS